MQDSLGDGLVHRPIRPATLVPIHCPAESGGIGRSGGEMIGDRTGVVEAEHLKTHCGTPIGGNQAPHYVGLQQVMVGVVMALA